MKLTNRFRCCAGANVLFTGLLVFCLCGCAQKSSDDKDAKQSSAVAIRAAEVAQKDFDVFFSTFGHVTSLNRVEVKPRTSGHITEIHFTEGQDVQKGDLLFSIDPRKTKASLDLANANLARDEAKLANARSTYQRAKALFEAERPLISQEEMDEYTTALQTAEATVLADKANIADIALSLEFCTVTAPASGRTGTIAIHAGNLVSAGSDTLVTINQLQPIKVNFSVPEKYLSLVREAYASEVGALVDIFDATTDEQLAVGKLNFIDNHIDRATGMVTVQAQLPNEDFVLWPGQYVRIRLKLQTLKNAVVVPSSAVQRGQNGPFIFVINADSTVDMQPVGLGEQRDLETVITEGLEPGQSIVTDGQLRLKPGSKIKIFATLNDAVQEALEK